MTSPRDRFPAHDVPAGDEGHGAPPTACERFDSVAAELALGSLTGAARSGALAHLDDCDNCRTLLEELSVTADALLLAAPEADPPAGFEVRLLARLGLGDAALGATSAAAQPVVTASSTVGTVVADTASTRPGAVVQLRRRARLLLAAAAAVVIAGAGIGVGAAVAPRHATQTAASGAIRTATLVSAASANMPATSVGEVAITTGKPSWVAMTFREPGYTGLVYCVVSENGRSKVVGSFWMYNGAASWAVSLASSGTSVSSAKVEGRNGAVLASADFSG